MSNQTVLLQMTALFPAATLVILHFYLEPLRWHFVYFRRSRPWCTVRDLYLATALASYLLPFKMGIPLRIALVARVLHFKSRFTLGRMALDSVLMFVCWAVLASLAGGLQVGPSILRLTSWQAVLASLVLLLVFFVLLYLARGSFLRSLEITHHVGARGALVVLAVGTVDVAGYGFRHGFMAVAVGLDPALFWTWSSLGLVATFSGILSGLPLGIGGYDAILLGSYIAVGGEPSQALQVVILNRILSFGTAGLLGAPAARRLGFGASIAEYWVRLKEMVGGRR
ncbi:MAG: hypothetical protein KatS3mg126_2289 [Lysobacteraceae bacterium]|nr:MAG: hypothetical protein KatS3mg126_2289 [Xanthomonadaceae bacterium]